MMKNILLLIVLSIVLFSCKNENDKITFLSSNVEKLNYVIEGKQHPNWKISPELKPDRLKVECGEESVEVKFISDIDSLIFNVNQGDTISFMVLFNQDTALTEIVGIPQNANFSKEYISNNEGRFSVKIPVIHELANIMVAISSVGQVDSNMIDMTTAYHQEVIQHFIKYKSHPAIGIINKYITEAFDNDSYMFYFALKMNACGYLFDDNNKIIDDQIIHHMGFDNPIDPFIDNVDVFEDFANKSQFRAFYVNHKSYYSKLITTYRALNPIQKMQHWLEDKFGFKYGNYLVTFSPLVGGAHATQKFENNGFNQTVMFVCRSEFSEDSSRNIDEMINSRVVFTEIDHNFVNPTSDTYLNEINKSFNQRNKWADDEVNGVSAYPSPYAVFNEYMTFTLFSLYCIDNFPKEDVEKYIPIMENMMVDYRGFINFDRFNQKVMELYSKNKEISINELYITMLNWSTQE